MTGLIAARSKNNIIGRNGKIPWKITGEQSQFRELTTGNTVIMGRRTYEEIGHPLPGRTTIVVSRSREYTGENLLTAHSVREALEMAGSGDVYLAGGYEIYSEGIKYADIMYITEVDTVIDDGDTFFPDFDLSDFDILTGETVSAELNYTRMTYVRKKS